MGGRGSSERIGADAIFKCFQMLPAGVQAGFDNFVLKNGDTKWMLFSDYHTEKGNYNNDVIVLTVLPGERNFVRMEEVDKHLPCKLSSSEVRETL